MNTNEFFSAIAKGNIAAVRKALEAGMSTDVCNENGESALDVACFHGQDVITELLLNPPTVKAPDLMAEIELNHDNPICIVGYSSIFPGSGASTEGFWKILSGNHHQMKEVPAERWSTDELYSADRKAPGKMYTRRGGFIDQSPYAFDANFFKIVPKEAEFMDPQQRLMLESAWFALEHAGINPQDLKEQPIGVYCGIMTHDYADMLIQSGVEHNNFIGTGNGASVLSGRVSYCLGLQGPCMTVDTACSSSLVTAHLAMRSLQNGECDLALAGGVNAMLAPGVTINCCKANMLAEDGVCKSFSEEADGYGRGEGAGMLVLKRYQDALRDGNTIHGLIRGSAINQDGASSGLTVPNKQAQILVIRKALETAGLSADDIDFIEAHGTGTLLGDPIEINALKEVFDKRNPNIVPTLIHSVKSFIGHLEAAAGVAGIIRVLESFKHQTLTALPVQGKMNPKIQLEGTQLAILQGKQAWKSVDGRVRRAGISSFGFSGTNAHMILEEPPTKELSREQRLEAQWTKESVLETPKQPSVDCNTQLLTLSAKDEKALLQMVKAYINWLEGKTEESADSWVNVAYSSQIGRAHFPHRLTIKADSLKECLQRLKRWSSETSVNNSAKPAIQVIIPDLEQVDLSSFQQRYKDDVVFSALCRLALEEVDQDIAREILQCFSKEHESNWQSEATKLVAMYALYQRYQRAGIHSSELISQGTGRFLAAVLDSRLSLGDVLRLFKVYATQDKVSLQDTVNSIVTYPSDGYWSVTSSQLCNDLYVGTMADQSASLSLAIRLNSGSQASMLDALSDAYRVGYDLNWCGLWQGSIRQFVSLPLYSFQRQHYRFKEKPAPTQVVTQAVTFKETATAGYQPTWQLSVLEKQATVSKQLVVMMLTASQWQNKAFVEALKQSLNDCDVKWLHEGSRGQTEQGYSIAYDQAEDWQWFFKQLRGLQVARIIDLRYMDLSNEHRTLLQHSRNGYFSKHLYQSQLLFQAWPEKIIEGGYIALFPQGKEVDMQIQLCHFGLQGQFRSTELAQKNIVSVQFNHQDSLAQSISDLARCRFEGVVYQQKQGQWYSQTLTSLPADMPLAKDTSYASKDTVAITGGLGSLGLTLAKWYAEKGIGHIALIARSQPNEEQAGQVMSVSKRYGVSVEVYQANVADKDQLSRVIQQISKNYTICEVFHLAGKATIKRFDTLIEQDYQDSLSAKVVGALNLRQALMTLDYWPRQVVLFSSVASLLPEPSQATYAASNKMLDGLAVLSQNTDKPIRAINWGLWGAAGVGAHEEFVKRIRKGSGALTESETKDWLNKILASSETQVAILSIDWAVYQKHLSLAEKAFVRPLLALPSSVNASPISSANGRQQLLSLNESERRTQVIDVIKQVVVDVSGKPIESLALDSTFEEELGLDSNLLAEIKDLLQERMGTEAEPYAATLLNEHESIEALTVFILTDLARHAPAQTEEETPTDYIRQLVMHAEAQVKIKSLKKINEPQEPPLVLIHTIMGSVFFYKALVEHLHYAGNIYGIDNPYFANLAVKFNSLEEMAKAYAHKIKEQFAGKSIRLAGLSFAGVVAYEVAQQLAVLDVRVDNVLMFDTAMPGAGDLTLPPNQREYVMGEIADDINAYYQAEIDNNQRILNAYSPDKPKNQLRVILLKARSRDSVNRTLPSLNDLCNGWLNLFCPEVYSVPGSHFSMFDRTYVNTTVQAMRYAYGQTEYYLDRDLTADVARNREKLFLQAAKNGDSYMVVRLLKAGVSPMVLDNDGTHAACYAAENDDLCSLSWIHYYTKGQLAVTGLVPFAIKGNALKTMSYLVEYSNVIALEEPDVSLFMDSNKKQSVILHGMTEAYAQREWMQILASHNDSAKGAAQPSAMQILPPKPVDIEEDSSPVQAFDLMLVNKITCGSKFSYDVVSKLKKGEPNKPKLFMFHAASGLALPYTGLDDLDVGDVYGFSNPFFGNQQLPGFTSIEEMAKHYIARMKQIQPQGPYYLAGWSLGGIVSQAMASMLEEQGEKVGIVIMIDSVNHFGKPYHPASEEAAINKILEGNTSLERYEGVREAIQKCYLNTSEILHGYQAKLFSGRVVLLKADEHETTLDNDGSDLVHWRKALLRDPFSGWGDLLPNFEIQSITGGHNELFDRGFIGGVHALLKNILAKVHVGNANTVSLAQRWGMNLVKSLRRADTRMVNLLLQQPGNDYSYQDAQGNLLDAIANYGQSELLEQLDARALMRLQTSSGSRASDIALEFGLIELFDRLEHATEPSFAKSDQSFFGKSSPIQSLQSKTFGLR